MACNGELVTGCVDGALPPAQTALVVAHVAGCLSCAWQAASERALRRLLGRATRLEPRPGVEARLRTRLAAERERGGR